MVQQLIVRGKTTTRWTSTRPAAGQRERPTSVRRLSLMGEFDMSQNGRPIPVPANVERLVAFLSLDSTPRTRATVAATLWMDTSEPQAGARLRAALWRLEKVAPGWVVRDGNRIALSSGVAVDLHRAIAQAVRLADDGYDLLLDDESYDDLRSDLLPHWDEDWLLFERERVRQLRVHALEALCRMLTERGRLPQAIDAGIAAIKSEPLRESAHRALIEAHLAEGNVSEANRQFYAYRDLLHEHLGISPTAKLRELVLGLGGAEARR